MFDADSDIVLINDPGPFAAGIGRRGAKTRGKERTTIEIRADVLMHSFDTVALGAKPAAAILAKIKKDWAGITEMAAPATQRARQVARRAFDRGEAWALKRYSGGRMGAMPPNQTGRALIDSGRMREGLFVRFNPTDQSYTTNLPVNRGTPEAFGPGQFEAMWEKLFRLIPALRDIRLLLADEDVRAAINASERDMITKVTDATEAKLKSLAAARKRVAMQVLAALWQVAGM